MLKPFFIFVFDILLFCRSFQVTERCEKIAKFMAIHFILGLLRGFPLIVPTIVYYSDNKHFELTVKVVMIFFLVIHALLAVIAILDSDCQETVTQDPVTRQKKQSERFEEIAIQIPDSEVQKPGWREELVR